MKLTHLGIKSAVVVATLALAAAPASAQRRDHGRSSEGQASEGRAVPRSEGRRAEAPRAQAQAPRAEAPRAQAPRAETPRASQAPRVEMPRAQTPRVEAPRSQAPQTFTPRVEGRTNVPTYRNDGRRDGGSVAVGPRAVPRSEVIVPRGDRGHDRGVVVAPRGYGYAPRVYAPRYEGSYRPYVHSYGYRPYVFRPRTRLSFGLYLGFGVPYSYVYSYPVPVYGYGAPSAPVYITPNSTMYGGIALEITPSDAQVFVDGQYVGQVADFDGTTAPLNLTAGQHRLQLSAPGYEPMTMDINVVPGQLIPYRGDLQPYRY
jgi:hypothetical protein